MSESPFVPSLFDVISYINFCVPLCLHLIRSFAVQLFLSVSDGVYCIGFVTYITPIYVTHDMSTQRAMR